MANRRSNFANAFETQLTAPMTATDLTASVVSTVGAPTSPCYLVIDPEVNAKREYVYFDGAFSGTAFVATVAANRHLAGSAAASGLTHDVGAVVRVSPVAQAFIDLWDRSDAHAAAADPHGQYATDADLSNHTAAADPHPAYATDADLTTHVGAADPHTGYVLESEHTKAAHDALALSHASLSDRTTGDPHTQYPLKANMGIVAAEVLTLETTTSLTFADLATVGPTATFVAPASGRVLVRVDVEQSNSASAFVVSALQILQGVTVVEAPSDDRSAVNFGTNRATTGTSLLVSGLTPGTTYDARLKYRVSGNTGTFLRRRVTVIPSL